MENTDNTQGKQDAQSPENESANTESIGNKIRATQQGFKPPIGISQGNPPPQAQPVLSTLSNIPAIEFAQMVELESGEGVVLYYPKKVDFDIGDVLYLRERESGENGLVVQVIEKSTASYPQADSKALFRLMVSVRASQIQRSHNEPPETIDEFLALRFKVRTAIVNGVWSAHEGRVVTRNVDVFQISPNFLLQKVIISEPSLNLLLGDYKSEPLDVFGGGFEKVNLVSGMKGGGKSHIVKGIITESLKVGMSAIVFDINNEYSKISPNVLSLVPCVNLKFRLDYLEIETLFRLIRRLAPFPERTAFAAEAMIPQIIRNQKSLNMIPDMEALRNAALQVIPGPIANEALQNMRHGYERSIDIISGYSLIMTAQEAQDEDAFISGQRTQAPSVLSLRSVFQSILATSKQQPQGRPQVLVFDIGGMSSMIQRVVVALVLDHLKEACDKQTVAYQNNQQKFPIYPSVYFEEAHMYMEDKDINDLIPVIRHIGINVFFISNTPGALPDSVFRLLDNLIMTRLVNRKDIDRLADCGLADKETLVGFAQNLRDHHALFLSAKNGATQNFPLVFHVRDFLLPKSGQTRSQWEAMRIIAQANLQNTNASNTSNSNPTGTP